MHLLQVVCMSLLWLCLSLLFFEIMACTLSAQLQSFQPGADVLSVPRTSPRGKLAKNRGDLS